MSDRLIRRRGSERKNLRRKEPENLLSAYLLTIQQSYPLTFLSSYLLLFLWL
jgi:hypothetical protein